MTLGREVTFQLANFYLAKQFYSSENKPWLKLTAQEQQAGTRWFASSVPGFMPPDNIGVLLMGKLAKGRAPLNNA